MHVVKKGQKRTE